MHPANQENLPVNLFEMQRERVRQKAREIQKNRKIQREGIISKSEICQATGNAHLTSEEFKEDEI